MNKIKRKKLPSALIQALGAGVAVSVIATAAHGQQAQRVEKIEVTGSNIKRVDAETAQPIIIISRDDIEQSGKATVAEYLQTLTVDGQGSLPTSFGNGFAGGSTAISIRGLGANATLVLLNGRRLAPYGRPDDFQKQLTDLSTIPLEAIDRIEVLKDGASAIYGSDALAGVVNIILRKDFTGVIGKASAGTSRYSDGNKYKGSITAGAGDLARDRFNFFVNLEASKSDEIHFRDRDRKWIGEGDVRPWGYDILGNQWIRGTISGNNSATQSRVGNVRNPATNAYVALPGCAQFNPITPPIDGDLGGCSFDRGQYRSFQPKAQGANLFAGVFVTEAAEPSITGESEKAPLVRIETLTSPITIDGSGADWAGQRVDTRELGATLPTPVPETSLRVRYRLGRHERNVYALFDILDDAVIRYDSEFPRLDASDHIELSMISADDEFLRFAIAESGDGAARISLVRPDG